MFFQAQYNRQRKQLVGRIPLSISHRIISFFVIRIYKVSTVSHTKILLCIFRVYLGMGFSLLVVAEGFTYIVNMVRKTRYFRRT